MGKSTEQEKITMHLTRARMQGAAATLTLDDWQRTLADFGGLCAYCLEKPYEVLEHFSLVQQAGTTVNNCVPACLSCNVKKRHYQGEELLARMGVETVERVRAYLASRQFTSGSSARQRQVPTRLPNPSEDDPYRTLEQVAAHLGVSRDISYRIMRSLQITPNKFGTHKIYLTLDDVERICRYYERKRKREEA